MRRPILAGLILAAALGLTAAEAEPPDCSVGAAPVVSEGLPLRPCAAPSAVVVHRGPERAPDPTPRGAVYDPVGQAQRAMDAARRRAQEAGYGASPPQGGVRYAVPWIVPRPRPHPGFGFVIDAGDVFIRYGDVPRRFRHGPKPRPHPERPTEDRLQGEHRR